LHNSLNREIGRELAIIVYPFDSTVKPFRPFVATMRLLFVDHIGVRATCGRRDVAMNTIPNLKA
jgi:hypothetical protein